MELTFANRPHEYTGRTDIGRFRQKFDAVMTAIKDGIQDADIPVSTTDTSGFQKVSCNYDPRYGGGHYLPNIYRYEYCNEHRDRIDVLFMRATKTPQAYTMRCRVVVSVVARGDNSDPARMIIGTNWYGHAETFKADKGFKVLDKISDDFEFEEDVCKTIVCSFEETKSKKIDIEAIVATIVNGYNAIKRLEKKMAARENINAMIAGAVSGIIEDAADEDNFHTSKVGENHNTLYYGTGNNYSDDVVKVYTYSKTINLGPGIGTSNSIGFKQIDFGTFCEDLKDYIDAVKNLRAAMDKLKGHLVKKEKKEE